MSKSKLTQFLQDQQINRSFFDWFPGHMREAMRNMRSLLAGIDCVIELHDARIPLTGRNPNLSKELNHRECSHLLLLNKCDLAPQRKMKSNIIMTSLKQNPKKNYMRIRDWIVQNVVPRRSADIWNGINVLVVGIPNVGKSTLLNILREQAIRTGNMDHESLKKRRQVCAVGFQPGVTRSVMNRIRISTNPLIYAIDTPGILPPSSSETNDVDWLRASCRIAHDITTEFLFHYMSEYGYTELFNQRYGVKKSIQMFHEFMLVIAGNVDQMANAERRFLNDAQTGAIGRICFDDDIIQN
ncbi:hypothetical protein ACOME3_004010 [Neoechinorhynchus agilis]